MTRVFICYRRDDSAAYAGRLYDRLIAHFGDGQVFMDIDQIEPGEDFVEVIQRTVGACQTAVVLIGKGWLGSADAEGRRRLDDPEDFVRLELATALERRIKVVPVLVGGASMPKAQQLPEALAMLARRNAIEISDTRFHADVNRLIAAIEKSQGSARAAADGSGAAAATGETVQISSDPAPAAPAPAPLPERETAEPAAEPVPQPPPAAPPADEAASAAPPPSARPAAPTAAGKRLSLRAAVGGASALALLGLAYLFGQFDRPAPPSEPEQEALPPVPPLAPVQATPPTEAALPIRIRAQDTYVSGDKRSTALRAFAKSLDAVSSARIRFEVLPSGSVFPAWESLDAVARGKADAAWVSAAYFHGKSAAFGLIDEPPFGPAPPGYARWREDLKVAAYVEDLYRSFGVIGLLCGVTGPNADLWSRKAIDRPADLKGLKTRALGLKADILTAAGVAVVALPAGEIYQALNSGVLDAVQVSDPALGVALGLPSLSKHLYFPGAMAPASGVDLIINAGVWMRLAEQDRVALRAACRRNVQAMLDTSEAESWNALTAVTGAGVTVRALPAPVLNGLRAAWAQVAADKRAEPAFSTLSELIRTAAKGE